MKSSINFTVYRRYKFLNNRDINPTGWNSMEIVPALGKKFENLKITDWCSTEGGVPSDGENH